MDLIAPEQIKKFLGTLALSLCLGTPTLQAQEPLFGTHYEITRVKEKALRQEMSDFSGVTYDPWTKNYLILDDSCKILEIKITKEDISSLRTIPLRGLEDCEGITALPLSKTQEHSRMAIVEERKGNVAVFTLSADKEAIDCKKECDIFSVPSSTNFLRKNSGLEAIASELLPSTHIRLYLGKEDFPKKLFVGILGLNSLETTILWEAEQRLPSKSDIAGMEVFGESLLILDERGDWIREVHKMTGELLSQFKIDRGSWLEKHEGIALSKHGDIFELVVVAEPHSVLVHHIKRKPSSAPPQ